MGYAPETAVSPLQQAPPDRQSMTVEQWAQYGRVLLLGDGRLDQNEKKILVDLMNELFQRGSQGPLGAGQTPPSDAPAADQGAPMSPQDMNQNTEPMYDDQQEIVD